jgi:hypothetical protein
LAVHSSCTVTILTTETSEHAHECLLPRLSWSWIALLHSHIHRKPITSITAALLPSVTYLLTLLCITPLISLKYSIFSLQIAYDPHV